MNSKDEKNNAWGSGGRSIWGGGDGGSPRRQLVAGFFIGMAFGLAIGMMF